MKRTIPPLAALLATLLDEDPARVRHVVRRCREAGLLSQAKQGPGAAAATSVDCARALIACLGTEGGAGVRAPERLKYFLETQPAGLMIDGRDTGRPTPRYIEKQIGLGIPPKKKKGEKYLGDPVTYVAGLIDGIADANRRRNNLSMASWRAKVIRAGQRVPDLIRIQQRGAATAEFEWTVETSKKRHSVVLAFGEPFLREFYHLRRENDWTKFTRLIDMAEKESRNRHGGRAGVGVFTTAECNGIVILRLGMWLGGYDPKAGS